jgi:hypothetical protein
MAGRDFAVDESISFNGTFEEAVDSLLDEYHDKPGRPVGKVYRDPGMQSRVLLIQLDGQSQGKAPGQGGS